MEKRWAPSCCTGDAISDTIKFIEVTQGPEKGTLELKTNPLKILLDPFKWSEGWPDDAVEDEAVAKDGFHLVFRIISHKGNAYKAVISEKEKATAILKLSLDFNAERPAFLFETWEEYLKW